MIFAVIIIMCITEFQCDSLFGNWKTQQMTFISEGNDPIIIDLTDPNVLAKKIYKSGKQQYGRRVPNKKHALKEISTSLSNFRKTSLMINDNYQFVLANYNLIVDSYGIPGWHLGDTIMGNWHQKNDTLILSIGNEIFNYDWIFRINELTSDTLKLRQIGGLLDKEKEILFKRQ
ncbi:MAG TPA: hypothetical protein VFG10_02685 [Saprospiraceae bacterium]|nr:hypothetical protein [Saprospiraceae bacterium]